MRPATLGIPENRDPGLIRGTQDPGPGPETLYLGPRTGDPISGNRDPIPLRGTRDHT